MESSAEQKFDGGVNFKCTLDPMDLSNILNVDYMTSDIKQKLVEGLVEKLLAPILPDVHMLANKIAKSLREAHTEEENGK